MQYHFLASVISLVLLLSSTITAHYVLTAPPTRGMQEELMTQAPCGGFNTVSQNRTNWPLGIPIKITAYHKDANFTTYLTLKSNPSAVSDFVPFSSTILGNVGKQTIDFSIDKPSDTFLNNLGLKSSNELIGKDGTIMTVYDAGDGVLYQCGDVKFTATGGTPTSDTSSIMPSLWNITVLVAIFSIVLGILDVLLI